MDDYSDFTEDPPQYLTDLLRVPPSREAAGRLAGTVAAGFKEQQQRQQRNNNNNSVSQTASLYLQAAARHLPATTASVAAASGQSTHAAAGGNSKGGGGGADMELEMKNTQIVFEIVEAIGHAVTLCQPRALIAQSGILPVLGNMMPSSNTGASSSSPSLTSPGPVLAAVHAEFLQACVYAGHYAYAERSVTGTWPRPTGTVSVRNVLRYFYLRGVVHLACQRWELAVRCFRTCLCVPSEVVSAVQLAAWKKLVLVQCLVETDDAVAQPTTLPSPTSTCVYRFINAAVTESKAKAANQQHGTTTPARGAPEDASTTILHLVDNLETGDSSARENNNNNNRARYPSMGVAVYAALALAFCDMDRPALQRQLTEHERFLTADGNWGLAQQVATALPRRQLVSWSRVYSSISLDELADLLNLSVEDLSRLLLQVSIAKEWPIQVSDTRMITFSRLVPQIGDTARTTQELVALAKLVQKMDATLSASSKFLSLARKEGRDASSSGDKGNAPAPGPRGVEDI